MGNGVAARRLVVREGYAVLLTAELFLSIPQESARLTDFTVRSGEVMLRRLFREEGERARSDYLAMEDHAARARWRVRRLRVTARCEPTDDRHCRVLLTAELNGTVLQSEERVWNLNEEQAADARGGQKMPDFDKKLTNFTDRVSQTLLQSEGKCGIITKMSSEDGKNSFFDMRGGSPRRMTNRPIERGVYVKGYVGKNQKSRA